MLDAEAQALVLTVDITPVDLQSVRSAGHSADPPAPHGVDSPLEANVLGLAGGSLDEPIYLVTVDSLYGGRWGAELASALNCPRENVVVLASHTHFAPGSDPGLPKLGPTNGDYLAEAAARVARAVAEATWHRGVRIVAATSVAPGFFVNRRQPVLGVGLRIPGYGRVVLAPHPKGSVDPALRLFELRAADDELLAIGWGVGCHPVCSPDRGAISADFPGRVRHRLREAGGSVPVFFFQGFSGDVRPATTSRRPPRGLKNLLRYLLGGFRTFVPQTRDAFETWCRDLSTVAVSARATCRDSGAIAPSIQRLAGATRGEWERTPQVGMLRLSDRLAILTVNAEMMSDHVAELPAAYADDVVIPATCADEVIGYWPTSVMLAEGGYEGCGSREFFPPVDWEQDDPDVLWRTTLAGVEGRES